MQWWQILLITLICINVLFFLCIVFYKHFFKRIFDLIGSFFGILLLIIPFIVISIIIKCDSKGPVLFKQKRLGRNKKTFTILKFRTMCENAYEKGGIVISETDNRITKVGKILRRTSMDELPQIFNIFIGKMSFIGPRPILDWEYEKYAKEEFEDRFVVRPGLFCSVDVVARNAKRETQFSMDADYGKNYNFWIDLKIFFGVFKTVFTGKGVYRDEGEDYEK